MRRFKTLLVAGAAVALLAPPPHAEAQAAGTGGQPKDTLVLERIESGIVAAPDVKVTDFDGDVGTLVGGYVGWLNDQTLLLGGAGYWLANGRRDQELAYGGLLVGWTANGHGRIAFGARGLVGAGQATLSDQVTLLRPGSPPRGFRDGRPSISTGSTSVRVWYDRDFFIFEPQANVVIKLTDVVRLDWGVGYRVVGAADGLEDRLRGVTGSVAIRFGGK